MRCAGSRWISTCWSAVKTCRTVTRCSSRGSKSNASNPTSRPTTSTAPGDCVSYREPCNLLNMALRVAFKSCRASRCPIYRQHHRTGRSSKLAQVAVYGNPSRNRTARVEEIRTIPWVTARVPESLFPRTRALRGALSTDHVGGPSLALGSLGHECIMRWVLTGCTGGRDIWRRQKRNDGLRRRRCWHAIPAHPFHVRNASKSYCL
jgi:hypothetical protein